ncbi:hypothetical protein L8S13_02250 [Vibrio lentus]|uniref:hypothetical protein n=1 Tax=Vibrio lentus TaxID=136468 RepID=UPI0024691021|nr:hypothetical protein [Vibrio lentus]MDH5925105.1 hypothetical protein [Vibrio lentus]
MTKPTKPNDKKDSPQRPIKREIIAPGGDVRSSADGASEMIPPKRTRKNRR